MQVQLSYHSSKRKSVLNNSVGKGVMMANLILFQLSTAFAEKIHGCIIFEICPEHPVDCRFAALPPVTGCGQQPAEKSIKLQTNE